MELKWINNSGQINNFYLILFVFSNLFWLIIFLFRIKKTIPIPESKKNWKFFSGINQNGKKNGFSDEEQQQQKNLTKMTILFLILEFSN